MLKVTRLLFACCALIIAAAWLSISVYHLYWGFVYELSRDSSRALHSLWQILDMVRNPGLFWRCYTHQSFLMGFVNLLILCLAGLLYWVHSKRAKSITHSFGEDLYKDICHERPQVRWICSIGLILINCVFITGSIECMGMIRHYGLRDLAYISDGLGHYEFGEILYSYTRDERGTTLASTCGWDGHDSDRLEVRNERLNRMVESTYGPKSVEMANRLSVLAGHLSSHFEDYAGAAIARKKAMAIFRMIGKQNRYAENIGFLAFDLIESGHPSEAKQTIQQAIEIANSSGFSAYKRNTLLDSLWPAVLKMGDKTWANQIRTMQTKTEPLEEKDFDLPILWWVCTALLISLNFAVGPARRRLLNQLNSKWEMAMRSSDSIELKNIYLNKLINLEMFRGNIELADDYSSQLLNTQHAA